MMRKILTVRKVKCSRRGVGEVVEIAWILRRAEPVDIRKVSELSVCKNYQRGRRWYVAQMFISVFIIRTQKERHKTSVRSDTMPQPR